MAGLMGRHFGIDPIDVLKSNTKRFAIRLAAYRYSVAEERKREEAQAKAARSRKY